MEIPVKYYSVLPVYFIAVVSIAFQPPFLATVITMSIIFFPRSVAVTFYISLQTQLSPHVREIALLASE